MFIPLISSSDEGSAQYGNPHTLPRLRPKFAYTDRLDGRALGAGWRTGAGVSWRWGDGGAVWAEGGEVGVWLRRRR